MPLFLLFLFKNKIKSWAYSKARRSQQGMVKSVVAHCLGSDLKIEINQT